MIAIQYKFLLSILALLLATGSASAKENLPNILFIMTDDLGIRDLGIYGSDYHYTPRLDSLAREGIRFTDAYAASAICSPTRASILTGRFPQRVHLTDALPWDRLPENPRLIPPNHLKELPSDYPTFAKALREAGYRTALFGKWHLGNEYQFFQQGEHLSYGFDEVYDVHWRIRNEVDKGVEGLTDQAIDFIERNREQPFALALFHHTPHVPLACPPEFIAFFDERPKGTLHNDQKYAGMLYHLDLSIGRLLDKLEALGLTENTVVIFTSDNGGLANLTNNHPYRSGKSTLYEGGIRVPLIIRWPGRIPAGLVSDAIVSSTDYYPTFLEIAGLPLDPTAHADGIGIMSLLAGGATVEPRTIYWHLPHYRQEGPQSALRSGDWKLLHNKIGDSFELYHLGEDPGESNDLSKTYPEMKQTLRAKLKDHLREAEAQRMRPNPEWNPNRPQGRIWNMGVFFPQEGGVFQVVKDRDYPDWFRYAEPPRSEGRRPLQGDPGID
jgi:arylsulfatase A